MDETTAKTGHVVGATYQSHYRHEVYTVTAAVGDGVEVEWEGGRTGWHCTQLTRKDRRLA